MSSKTLLSISDNYMSEAEYRKQKCLSQSTLGRYEREGIAGIPHLFEFIESPSMNFGSEVDCWITEGKEVFDQKYLVLDVPTPSPAYVQIAGELVKMEKERVGNILNAGIVKCFSSNELPDSEIEKAFNNLGAFPNYKKETKADAFRRNGGSYYDALIQTDGRKVITREEYADVLGTVQVLQTSPETKPYFGLQANKEGIERIYQYKFSAELDNVGLGPILLRGMADLVCVDHNKKKIIMVDLKTSCSKQLLNNGAEKGFAAHFLEYNYDIQARLYTRLLKKRLEGTEFADYEILPSYKYIICHRNTKEPMVYSFSQNHVIGDIVFAGHVLRDPEVIAHELKNYLDNGVPPLRDNGRDILDIIARK